MIVKRNKLLQFVLIQNDPDGLKLTQYHRAKAIESVIVEFDEHATREQVWESIEQFRLDGRKAFGI
jgi:hypothetical protein